jgi:thioredoxin-dependent peroxiredoxin
MLTGSMMTLQKYDLRLQHAQNATVICHICNALVASRNVSTRRRTIMAFVTVAAAQLPSRAGPALNSLRGRRVGAGAVSNQRAMFGGLFGGSTAGSAGPTMAISKGDKAPAFSAQDQNGNTISLSDFSGKQNVCLFFYPKDNTPGCTKQSCAFRDATEEFDGLDGAVIGVSGGTAAEHTLFDQQFKLKFPLLVDEDNTIRKAFGVPSTFGFLPGRVTYIIDKEGTVVEMYNSQLNVGEHVEVARKTLTKLAAK